MIFSRLRGHQDEVSAATFAFQEHAVVFRKSKTMLTLSLVMPALWHA
jgi:hypothetical protein